MTPVIKMRAEIALCWKLLATKYVGRKEPMTVSTVVTNNTRCLKLQIDGVTNRKEIASCWRTLAIKYVGRKKLMMITSQKSQDIVRNCY